MVRYGVNVEPGGIPASNSEFLPEEVVGYSNYGVQLALIWRRSGTRATLHTRLAQAPLPHTPAVVVTTNTRVC